MIHFIFTVENEISNYHFLLKLKEKKSKVVQGLGYPTNGLSKVYGMRRLEIEDLEIIVETGDVRRRYRESTAAQSKEVEGAGNTNEAASSRQDKDKQTVTSRAGQRP